MPPGGLFDWRLVSVPFDYPGEAEAWEVKVEGDSGLDLEVERVEEKVSDDGIDIGGERWEF